MVNALLTTAEPAMAMLPAAVQVNSPVGIRVIVPPPLVSGLGTVIVATAAVPEINVMPTVGAIVPALAIVGATADCPTSLPMVSELVIAKFVPQLNVSVPND